MKIYKYEFKQILVYERLNALQNNTLQTDSLENICLILKDKNVLGKLKNC